MQTIRAQSLPVGETAYPTAAEAIHASKQDNESWIARTGIASRFGQQITEAYRSGERVLIRLISGDVIGVWCEAGGVACELVKPSILESADRATIEHSSIDIVLDNTTLRWNRDSLIHRLAGRTLSNMQMSGKVLFLYAHGLPIVCFAVMRNRDTGNLFLFWEESD